MFIIWTVDSLMFLLDMSKENSKGEPHTDYTDLIFFMLRGSEREGERGAGFILYTLFHQSVFCLLFVSKFCLSAHFHLTKTTRV